jgi:hypothetical protein
MLLLYFSKAMYLKFFVFLFSFSYYSAIAQKITTIPFEELYGGVMIIKAQVGDYKDTLHFIFDSGSSHISLDSTTAADLGIVTAEQDFLIKGIGGLKKVKRTKPLTLKLPKLDTDTFDFSVNDYALLEESYGQRVDGIIGYSFINKYLLNVNFDSGVIHVYHKNTNYKKPKKGYTLHYRLPYLPNTNIPIKDDRVAAPSMYIDCGAGLALLLDERYARDSNFLQKNKKPLQIQVEGVAGIAKTRITTIKELKLGPFKFKKVPTYLYNDEFDILRYPIHSGLLGNDVLRRFNWWLNYSKNEIHITPNKSFHDVFDYSYTGLSIFLIDGVVTITEVIENSPAAKAGLQKDDVIIAIDGTIVTSVKQTKNLLQATNRKVDIIAIRNNKPIKAKLKIMRIY